MPQFVSGSTNSKSESRKKSISSVNSSGYERTFYVFSYSFDLLEVFCQQFHWNVYSNYFQDVVWKMMPSADASMQFVWTQGTNKLVIFFRLLAESQIVPGLRKNLRLQEEDRMYFVEVAGDELVKNLRDLLQKEACRTSYFDVIYKRVIIDYQEVMKLEIEQNEELANDGNASQFGGSARGSIDKGSHAGSGRAGHRNSLGSLNSKTRSGRQGSIAASGGGGSMTQSRRQSYLSQAR